MRTLLINPPIYHQEKYGKAPIYPYGPPLGIAYIAAYMEKEGLDVKAVDMSFFSMDKATEYIRKISPDIIGITCLTEQRAVVRLLCQKIKDIEPGIFIILGGPHATLMSEQVLRNFSADAIVIGEGEITTTDLVNTISIGGEIEHVRGIAFLKNNEFHQTPERKPIANLDELPFPALKYFNLDGYAKFPATDIVAKEIGNPRFIPMITSRGCVGRCQFCSTFKFWQYRWRARSAKNVVDEIEYLIKEYGSNVINIADDLFTVNKNRVIEICREILRRNLEIHWDCETRADMVDRDVLSWMRKAGCYCIAYGVESLSERILTNINKRTSKEDIERAFKITKDAGIKTSMFLMVGNPGETEDTIGETIDFIKKVKPEFVFLSMTMIFPGTAIYEWAKEHNFIDDEYWLTDKPAPLNAVENSMRNLQRWSSMILASNARGIKKILLNIRLFMEDKVGVRFSTILFEIWRKDRLLKRIKYPRIVTFLIRQFLV